MLNRLLKPYLLQAGPVGVLLIHGFTASPTELRPVGTHLHEQGFTVSGARLAGHGTDLGDLRATRWGDWIESAQSALEQLTTLCERVYVVGLSMGGVIAATCLRPSLFRGRHRSISASIPRSNALSLAGAPAPSTAARPAQRGPQHAVFFRTRPLYLRRHARLCVGSA